MVKPKLDNIYASLQLKMKADLTLSDVMDHSVMKGNHSESKWKNWLSDYLPTRYSITSGKVIDCTGATSDQIDLIVYDRVFSPPVVHLDDCDYVTAESIYAVFEIKPSINSFNIEYAKNKAASVRHLVRTASNIKHVQGNTKTDTKPIIAGLLATGSDLAIHDKAFNKAMAEKDANRKLNIGCSVDQSFVVYSDTIEISSTNNGLIFFFYNFLSQLQSIGSVSAIDYSEYLKSIGECCHNAKQ